ncbi:MAG: ATP-binding protein [Planctomycetota bacterium]
MNTPAAPRPETEAATPSAGPDAHRRLDDLAEIIGAYNQVTDKLQRNHARLQSEVARLRGELRSANDQLERARRLSALGEMAAGIAHEIRNPLAAMQLFVRMIREDLTPGSLDPAAALENADKVDQAVRGMAGIVDDVLAFSREVRPTRTWVTAGDLFDQAVALARPALEAQSVAVLRDEDPDHPVRLHLDPAQARQVLLNLLRNAAQALGKTRGPRRVVLSAEPARGERPASMSIADNGPGVPDDVADRIFNPFFTTRAAGTGLGLAIVHRIVDAHGGAIRVERPASGGARFVLTWPDSAEVVGDVAQPPAVLRLAETDAAPTPVPLAGAAA